MPADCDVSALKYRFLRVSGNPALVLWPCQFLNGHSFTEVSLLETKCIETCSLCACDCCECFCVFDPFEDVEPKTFMRRLSVERVELSCPQLPSFCGLNIFSRRPPEATSPDGP